VIGLALDQMIGSIIQMIALLETEQQQLEKLIEERINKICTMFEKLCVDMDLHCGNSQIFFAYIIVLTMINMIL
jgi:hypothetical protein